MSLSYISGLNEILIPPCVENALSQHYQCEECRFRYTLIGIGSFCPACGKPTTSATIEESLGLMRTFLEKIDILRTAFKMIYSPVETEKVLALIIEEHFCKIVSLLQKYCENQFQKNANAQDLKIRKNLFQNLSESSAVWKGLYGKGYEDIFDIQTYGQLSLFYQQRHLLIHTNGIVDSDYVTKTNDSRYSVDHRIVIKRDNLFDFIETASKFMKAIDFNYK